ncbi:MAG: 3-oxoacyl-ACP reductase [Candidatus Omnitrophica bacterium CG07_land_8_20_14_0_80_42_15]|uniref:3-oxoacyl-[acyl-carrier-protein] reductase n=1 Tax=Candidatus Aquitaenariimonas noxiae TaxID=1974741 RepID=A0A2J0KU16_9BACT|nr:MAG: 3-oxoacyl-ACP reductase [Candidatus Omnitrophica bacterium CG07_land_8_20_14_0_80_42_15]
MKLKGNVTLITGGGQGIGRSIALLFAEEGSDIAICDVNPDSLNQTKDEIKEKNRDCLTFTADVTKFDQVEDVVNKILDKFGRIDILVNNAGITRDSLLVRMSEEDWDRVLDVNLKGSFNCTKAVAKPMMKARGGKIINIASIIGIIGNPGQANYAASKGGMIALTKTMAKELASRNVRVNAIAPGFIKTAMTEKLSEDVKGAMLKEIPLSRFGEQGDVANIALFLAGEDSSYITGHVIQVDGGMVM